MSASIYVQYGSGCVSVPGWLNFDCSPTLLLQRLPILGGLIRPKLNCIFDDEIIYGDIVKGLPIKPESVDALFCSHVLEHLTLDDFNLALRNSFEYLKKGGLFRLIVPDLNWYISQYVSTKSDPLISIERKQLASVDFMLKTYLGETSSRTSIFGRLIQSFGNSRHLMMWDFDSMSYFLKMHGFTDIQKFHQGCGDDMFCRVESDHQFGECGQHLALQCSKP